MSNNLNLIIMGMYILNIQQRAYQYFFQKLPLQSPETVRCISMGALQMYKEHLSCIYETAHEIMVLIMKSTSEVSGEAVSQEALLFAHESMEADEGSDQNSDN